jgi:hypothetical protein
MHGMNPKRRYKFLFITSSTAKNHITVFIVGSQRVPLERSVEKAVGSGDGPARRTLLASHTRAA